MASLRSDYVPWYTQLYLTKVALVIFVMALPVTANKMDTNLNQAGCGKLGSKGRIHHGKPTSKENIPWIVQVFGIFDLSSGLSSLCAGSIITRNLILTAAHCLFNGAFALKVRVVYKSHLYQNGKAIEAEKMMVHPKYVNKYEMVHDIALLKLAVDLEFNRLIKPVCLPTAKMDIAGKTLVVAGWGRTESADSSKILLHAEVVALPDNECRARVPRIPHPFLRRRPVHPGPAICASGKNQGACDGDSGGPLTLSNDDGRTLQVGVVSFGPPCPTSSPTVYARVSSHIKWIRGALNRPRKWRKLQYTREEVNLG
ncbi:chymotrypsin-1-like [Dermacentor variabilis]|uniref:chymotrypsin-1-like n=1 Tax=Dermacentor variabilis TaxID=34621 RepID=UPI003F5BC9AA